MRRGADIAPSFAFGNSASHDRSRFVAFIKKYFLRALFPENCFLCDKVPDVLCAACCEKKELSPRRTCWICRAEIDIFLEVCPRCSPNGVLLPFLTTHFSLCRYENNVRSMIHAFKYGGELWPRRVFKFLLSGIPKNIFSCDVVMPIPSAVNTLKKRGFNQAALLARVLSRYNGASLDLKSLTRSTGKSLVGLSRRDRHRILRRVFHCRSKNLVGKKILLVDDVRTTGATLKAAATVLKKAGVASIATLSFAEVI